MNSETSTTKNRSRGAGRAIFWIDAAAAGMALAQVPPDIEAGLRKIGPIVDPACTAKLYRPSMPTNDVNSNVSRYTRESPLRAMSGSGPTLRICSTSSRPMRAAEAGRC